MKKLVPENFGKNYSIKIVEFPQSTVGDFEVLIRVEAAAMNRAEFTIIRNGPEGHFKANPFLGIEAAGEIVEKGKKVQHLRIGDRVCALVQSGAYAEYLSVSENLIFKLPSFFSFVEMSTIPEAFSLSYQLLKWHGQIQSGDLVLIHAGASSMGSAAIQLAKALGAEVVCTCRSVSKADYCQRLGADKVIVVNDLTFADEVLDFSGGRGSDIILDCVGKDYIDENLRSLAIEGRLILYGELSGEIKSIEMGQVVSRWNKIIGTTLRTRSELYKSELIKEMLNFCMPLFEKRQLVPNVYKTFPMNEVNSALKVFENNENTGRVVLTKFNS